jgi:hypothetical protein
VKRRASSLAVALLAAVCLLLNAASASAANSRLFPETGQSVRDAFLDFYDANGGVEIFGFPRTGEFPSNGHAVQYFQRARFEYWAENRPGEQVRLGMLGVELGKSRPPSVAAADPNRRYFQDTQHTIGGAFRDFWESRGGARIFGYPITEEMQENGRAVQYFQRARFEWNGENPPAYRVQLGLIGDEAIALGRVSVPANAAPKVAPAGAPPIPASAAGPGKLLVSTAQGGDFYLMDPNGENTALLGRGVDPALSREGTKIAFATNDQPNPGLWTMNVDGTGRALVYAGADVRGPMFSPDGTLIAFWERYLCTRILPGRKTVGDDCTRVKVIAATGGVDWLIPGQSAYASAPSWSSDGSRVLYKDEKTLSSASAKQDGRPLSPFEPRYATPAWSPLGSQIAVAFDMNHDHYEIGLVPDDGSPGVQLITQSPPFSNPPQTSLAPAWSPDGGKIAFVSDRDGALKVWTMNADGSNPVKISDLPIASNNSFERLVSWGGVPGQTILPQPAPAAAPTETPFSGPALRPAGRG